MSLRARLLAGMVALVATGLAVAAVLTYEEQRSFLLARVDQQVLSALGPISGQLRPEPAGGFRGARRGPAFPGRQLARGRALNILPPGTFGELRNAAGTVLRRRTFNYSESVGPNPLLPKSLPISTVGGTPHLFTVHSSGPAGMAYRAVAFQIGSDTAVVAVPLREAQDTLHRLVVVEALVGAGVIIALVALGWLVIRIGLRPLERIGRTASEIARGDLSRRVSPDDGRTEVGKLGRSLNAMLAQIETAFDDRTQSEERLRNFVADASHELRTPLAAIRGYAELFRLGAAEDRATLERAMARIESESARMGILVEELLVLAQLDQEPVARRLAVDLRELAQHAVDDGRVIAPDREIALAVDRPLVVLGEPHQLGQLLANLMRNAVTHTPAGTPVEVALRREGADAVVEVRDHGPGLAPDAAERVFERFWRTEGGRRRGPAGAGLGLAIVRAIVTAHGGSATAENARGGGARFIVRLPLAGDPAGPTGDAATAVSADSQLSPGRHSDRSQTVSNR